MSLYATDEYQTVKDFVLGLADKARTHSGYQFTTIRGELTSMINDDDINMRRFPRCKKAPRLFADGATGQTKSALLALADEIDAAEPAIQEYDTWLQTYIEQQSS